jgi:dienelactone hydrolase
LIKPNDPRLKSEFISYDYTKGGVKSKTFYHNLREPKKLPGIILVHENLTLNSYIEDVGRRAAVEEFITLAPTHYRHLAAIAEMMRKESYKRNAAVKKCSKTLLPLAST